MVMRNAEKRPHPICFSFLRCRCVGAGIGIITSRSSEDIDWRESGSVSRLL